MRKIEAKYVHHRAHTADDADALAEIHLGVTGGMRQRHECLLHPRSLQTDVILHHRVAAGIPVLGPQPLKNPLGRMPLLGRCTSVRLQDRVDHRRQRSQLRLLRWLRPLVSRRHRKPTHLGDRVPAQPEHSRRFPPAMPLKQHIPANRRVYFHLKHPRPSLPKPEKDSLASGRLLHRHAAALRRRSVADYSTAAHTRSMIGTPGSASTSSGNVGPHMLSRAVVVRTIGKLRALAALARATTLCFNSPVE